MKRAVISAIALIVLMCATDVFAQGINYPVGNPAGTSGTGNGRTDPDNLFIRNNVAGMTEIAVTDEEENTGKLGENSKGGWRLMGELQESIYKYRFERVLGPAAGVTSRATIFNPGLGGEITYTSKDHRYAIGMGAYQVFGFQAKIEDDPARFGRFSTFFDTKVASNDLAFGGAVRLHKTVSVGGSFIFGRAFLDLKAPTQSLAAFGIIRQSRIDVDDIGGAGFSVGIHFRPHERVSFGANYKSERKYKLEGDFETFAVAVLPTGPVFRAVTPKVEADFKLPQVGEIGMQVKPIDKLLLAFDFRFYDYTETLGRLRLEQEGTGRELLGVQIDAQDVRSVRFGGIYSLSDSTKINFGSAFTSNGFPKFPINPGLINVGGLDISGGFAKKIFGQWLSVGAAGIFGRVNQVRPPANRQFPGDYDGAGFLISVGLRMRL